jgi:hypothetical protein
MLFLATKRRQWKQKHVVNDQNKEDFFEKNQFLLAGLTFLNMLKDAVDTFKPYKSKWHLWRDLQQPLNGLKNILFSLGLAAFALVLIVMAFIAVPFVLLSRGWKASLNTVYLATNKIAALIAHSLAKAIRGLTQLAATPLTNLKEYSPRLFKEAVTAYLDSFGVNKAPNNHP